MTMRSLVFSSRRTLVIYLLLVLPFLVLAFLAYFLISQQLFEQKQASLVREAETKHEFVVNSITGGIQQLIITSNLLTSQLRLFGLELPVTDEIKTTLESLWVNAIMARKRYLQFRLLSLSGQELVRVNYDPDSDIAAPARVLQFKGGRDYMRQAFTLADHQILLTPAEVNQEFGKVEFPVRGVSRLIRPIFNPQQQRIGYLVINLSVDAVLRPLESIPNFIAMPWLIGARGDYMFGPDRSRLFGHQIPERRQYQLGIEFPEVWTQMQKASSGVTIRPGYMAVYSESFVGALPENVLAPALRSTWILDIVPDRRVRELLEDARWQLLLYLALAFVVISLMLFPWARWLSERSQRLRESLLAQATLDSMSAVLVTDIKGDILDVNKRFSDITGYSEQEVIGENSSLLRSDKHDAAFYASFWKELLEQGHWAGEFWNQRKSGEIYPQLTEINAVRDDHGQISYFVASFIDITAQKETERQLREASLRDPLTGCYNRRGIQEPLNSCMALSKRHESPYCLAVLDIDHFKQINDTLGHEAGDRVLKQFVELIQDQLRRTDLLARSGGEEFVVLMPMTSIPGAVRLLERIRSHLAGQSFDIVYTFSAGIAAGLAEDDRESVMHRADLGLYAAKSAGRNRLMVMGPSGEPVPASEVLGEAPPTPTQVPKSSGD